MGCLLSSSNPLEDMCKNEFVLYKDEKKINQNETPTVKDLINDRNVKNAIIHDTKKTVYVGHDEEGRTNIGMVMHKDSKEASDFINGQIKQLAFNNGNNYLLPNK